MHSKGLIHTLRLIANMDLEYGSKLKMKWTESMRFIICESFFSSSMCVCADVVAVAQIHVEISAYPLSYAVI